MCDCELWHPKGAVSDNVSVSISTSARKAPARGPLNDPRSSEGALYRLSIGTLYCNGKQAGTFRGKLRQGPCATAKSRYWWCLRCLVNLVDPASSRMLLSRAKPCKSQSTRTQSGSANGSLYQR
jgi:hypothetical protein